MSNCVRTLAMLVWVVTCLGCRRTSTETHDAGGATDLAAIARESPSAGPSKDSKPPAAHEDSAKASTQPTTEIDWKQVAFIKYVHGRCGEVNETAANSECAFAFDIPTFLKKVTSGATDGRCFRGGKVEVSGWAYPSNVVPFCRKIPSTKVYQKKKTSCWQTGESGGSIFWHRELLDGTTIYVLRLEYPAAMKSEMDGIVNRINSSWHHPLNESDKGTASDEHEDAKKAAPGSEPTVTYDFDTGKNSFQGDPFECP